MKVRRSPAAQIAALLDQLHAQAGLGQGAGRAHSGHAAADDGDGPLRVLLRTAQKSSISGAKSLFCELNHS
jgi:hypothetical protein